MSKSSVCEYLGARIRPLAPVPVAFATVLLLTACSSGVERFASFSFGSGYENASATSPAEAPSAATAIPAQSKPWRVASAQASTGAPSGGHLYAARIDLPPLKDTGGASRTRTADGYGRYNRPPLHDGAYAGPRVRPYDDEPYPHPRKDYDEPYSKKGGYDEPYPEKGDYGGHYPKKGAYAEPDDFAPHYPRGKGPYKPHAKADYGPDYEPSYKDEPYPEGGPVHDRPRYPDHAGGHPPKGGKIVKVEPGDTLYKLAIRYGTTVHDIIAANGLHSDLIHVGQELIVPGAGPVAYAATEAKPDKEPERRYGGKGPRCVATGDCHVVRAGESLGSIAKRHGVAAIDILDANGLSDPRQLRPGHVLSIPKNRDEAKAERGRGADIRDRYAARNDDTARDGAYPPAGSDETSSADARPEPEEKAAPERRNYAAVAPNAGRAPDGENCEDALANPLPRSGRTFREPVEGLVVQKFGPQADGSVNEGINISVPKGTPIKAAENGVVAYVGNELSGFGNLVLIRHADDYVTAYAHADEVLVRRCDVVKRGQVIAKAGATGDVAQPQLHFEIRKASKPVDPTTLF